MAKPKKASTNTLKDLAEAATEAAEMETLATEAESRLAEANHKMANQAQEIVLLKDKVARLSTNPALSEDDLQRLADHNTTIEFRRPDFRSGQARVVLTTNKRPKKVLHAETFVGAMARFREVMR